jgi:hypothetical protein
LLGTTALYHWDGSAWTKKTLPAGSSSFVHVASEQRGIVWLVSASQSNGLLYRGDGTTWASEGPLGSASFGAVAARSPTEIWASTNDGHTYRFDGTAWTEVVTPTAGGGKIAFSSSRAWMSAPTGLLSYRP